MAHKISSKTILQFSSSPYIDTMMVKSHSHTYIITRFIYSLTLKHNDSSSHRIILPAIRVSEQLRRRRRERIQREYPLGYWLLRRSIESRHGWVHLRVRANRTSDRWRIRSRIRVYLRRFRLRRGRSTWSMQTHLRRIRVHIILLILINPTYELVVVVVVVFVEIGTWHNVSWIWWKERILSRVLKEDII